MMPGWIKLYRKIMENDLWLEQPFSKGQAWIDLLLLANFEDKKISMNGEEILIKRGSFVTSIRKLSDRWGWSRSKTTRLLDELKKSQMVNIKRANKKTIIEIVNYAEYQGFADDSENKKSHKKSHKRANERSQNEHKTNTTKEERSITSTVTLTPPVDTGASVTPEEDDDSDWDTGWTDPNADLGGNDGNI